MLCDRFVRGVNNERIQRRLLSELDLTFKKVYEIALSMEATALHMVDLQSTPSMVKMAPASAKKVYSSQTPRPKTEMKECYRWGKNHNPAKCRFNDSMCH